jgi:hypothetical protein
MSEAESNRNDAPRAVRVLPVLSYRSPEGNPTEPSRKFLGTVLGIWALLMVFGCGLAIPAQIAYAGYLHDQDVTEWFATEVTRRGCERARRAGIYSTPPPVPAVHAPFAWTPLGLGIALVGMPILGIAVARLSHHALKRTGGYKLLARRMIPFMFVIPAAVLVVGLAGYGPREVWRLFTLPMIFCGAIVHRFSQSFASSEEFAQAIFGSDEKPP